MMRIIRTLLVALVSQAPHGNALAEEGAAIQTASADFELGLRLVREGRFDAALTAFERAYRVRPHPAVLYNIGQAQLSAGRPLQAIATFERLLSESEPAVPDARRVEIEHVLAETRGKLGRLEVEVAPKDAELWVDGQRVGARNAVDVMPGSHLVSARRAGFSAKVEPVEVAQGQAKVVTVVLVPSPPSMNPQGFVRVVCGVPGVLLSVDRKPRGTTPFLHPLIVEAGVRNVEFTRPGYLPSSDRTQVRAGAGALVECSMVPDPASGRVGRLDIVASERMVDVTIDGMRPSDAPLPAGPHRVRVAKDGFVPWERTVWSAPGSRRVTVQLEPTWERRRELESQRHRRFVWSLGGLVGGAALVGGAGAIYSWNDTRYRAWQQERDGLQSMAAQGDLDAGYHERSRNLAGQAAEIQRVDDIALGMAIAGGSALVSAAIIGLITLIDGRH